MIGTMKILKSPKPSLDHLIKIVRLKIQRDRIDRWYRGVNVS